MKKEELEKIPDEQLEVEQTRDEQLKVEQILNDQSLNDDLSKKEKKAKILFFNGIVIFIVFLLMSIIWNFINISIIVITGGAKLVSLLVVLPFSVYFGIPSLLIGVLTIALTTASLILSRNRKILKIVVLIFSVLLIIIDIIFFNIIFMA